MGPQTKDVQNILAFALADGGLNDDEAHFVRALAARVGLDDAQLDRLMADAANGQRTLKLSRDSDEARQTVGLLAEAAAADRNITGRERRMLAKIAAHAGMDESAVSEMIDTALAAHALDDARVDALIEAIYDEFGTWDAATRQAQIQELADLGRDAVLPLLRLMESYRVPDGLPDALELKRMVADALGTLGDERAVYYLVQQVSIGQQDDETTNAALRAAAAGAIGKITGNAFTPDDDGVTAACAWWTSGGPERERYDKRAL